MWELLAPQIIKYLENKDNFRDLSQQIIDAVNDFNYNILILFVSDYFQKALKSFFEVKCTNSNFKYWYTYLKWLAFY